MSDRQQAEEPELPDQLPDEELLQEGEPSTLPSEDGETVLINAVGFVGESALLSEEQRGRLAASVQGRELGFAQIDALAEAANAMLRQNGYLLARAIVPPQDVTEGTLTLEIVDGQLEDVSFNYEADARINRGLLTRILDRHADRGNLTRRDLESALLRMNDLPGVSARSRLAPGEAAGTSRLVIDVAEEPLFTPVLYGDNFGSPSTGEGQAHARLFISDLTGAGDQASLGVSLSEGQRYLSGALSLPLSASGVSAHLNYGYLSYENIDPVGEAAGLEGRAHYGSAGLAWQALRTRAANLRLSGYLNFKALTDDSTAGRLSDKRILSGTLSVLGDASDSFAGGGLLQTTIDWTYGDLDLSRVPSAELIDSISQRTQGGFHRLNVDMIRLQSLPGRFSLLLRMSGQWASKNLDSSESFSLGGPYGVRGWPVGEGRGDMGVTGTAELRYDVPVAPNLGNLQLSAFLDAGRVRLSKHIYGLPVLNACGCNSYALASAGGGFSWQHRYFSVSAHWAHGLGDNPGRSVLDGTNVDGGTGRQQFWLSGSIRF